MQHVLQQQHAVLQLQVLFGMHARQQCWHCLNLQAQVADLCALHAADIHVACIVVPAVKQTPSNICVDRSAASSKCLQYVCLHHQA